MNRARQSHRACHSCHAATRGLHCRRPARNHGGTGGRVMRVAYIGLGTMGSRMVRNLLKAGHEVVVNDVRREAAEPLVGLGAHWADSPALAASGAEITFTSLPGPREVEAVAMGESGVLHGIAE